MSTQVQGFAARSNLHLTVLGVVLFFGTWYLAAVLKLTPAQFFPMPHQVLSKLIALTQEPFAGFTLQQHMAASLLRYAWGFGLAALIGVPLGLLMGWFRWLDDVITPLFDSLRFIAPVAWVPFAALWFGTGAGGPTLIIFAGAFPPCLINAYRGARGVDARFLEAASMLGVGSFKTITEVLFPAAVPSIIAGLRIGAGLGWMSLVGDGVSRCQGAERNRYRHRDGRDGRHRHGGCDYRFSVAKN
jgi:ABC-type nitrate/sulfonate/bicarbonate transport system permease component